MKVSELNRRLSEGEDCVSSVTWKQWLWGCDMQAPLTPAFNKCHLLGFAIARHQALFRGEQANVRLGDCLPSLLYADKLASDLTLRQLRDTLEDLQMHWREHGNSGDGVVDAVNALWTQFGSIAVSHKGMDDLASVDPEAPMRLNHAAIRRFVAIFCVLYRHLDLEDSAAQYQGEKFSMEIEPYHRQAGLDAFNEHAMYADLPPAARITYKQDFSGMYHSITQVVYFHYPDYNRRRQISLEEIRKGESMLHCLSVARELRPEIPLVFEDEAWNPGWNWLLLAGGTVYLVKPPATVVASDNIWKLLAAAS